jgi:hypothetical protein
MESAAATSQRCDRGQLTVDAVCSADSRRKAKMDYSTSRCNTDDMMCDRASSLWSLRTEAPALLQERAWRGGHEAAAGTQETRKDA